MESWTRRLPCSMRSTNFDFWPRRDNTRVYEQDRRSKQTVRRSPDNLHQFSRLATAPVRRPQRVETARLRRLWESRSRDGVDAPMASNNRRRRRCPRRPSRRPTTSVTAVWRRRDGDARDDPIVSRRFGVPPSIVGRPLDRLSDPRFSRPMYPPRNGGSRLGRERAKPAARYMRQNYAVITRRARRAATARQTGTPDALVRRVVGRTQAAIAQSVLAAKTQTSSGDHPRWPFRREPF